LCFPKAEYNCWENKARAFLGENELSVLLLASGPRVSGSREISSSLITNNIVVELVWCEQFSIEMHTEQFYFNE
jgi:hypothetical protein